MPTRRQFLRSSLIAGTGAVLGSGCAGNRANPLDACREPAAGLPVATPSDTFDLLLRGGTIVDGTGRPGFPADVAVRADRIVAIGNLAGANAARSCDVRGLIVAPGFVDAHAHSDLRRHPRAQSKVFQGVTLDVCGPDGGSPFPEAPDPEATSPAKTVCADFATWAGMHGPTAIDIAAYIGHGTVRRHVLGPVGRAATDSELRTMQDLLTQAFEQGALGLSSGLEYFPGNMATTAELVGLCKIAARFDRPYVTHIRNEDDKVQEAVAEAITIARESGAPLLISHLKVGGKPNWHQLEPVLASIDAARAQGLDVHCDAYPYEAWSTSLATNFPGWAKDGGQFVARLQDAAERERMRPETEQSVAANGGWGALMLGGGLGSADRGLLGRRLDEVATERGQDPFALACELLTRGNVSILGFGIQESDMDRILVQPWCLVASDGSAVPTAGRGGHPRSFGAFPRAFRRYVREQRALSIEAMVHKMTALPAKVLRLPDRGVLAAGRLANLVVFDAERLTDHATYLDPQRYATGLRHLIVRGALAVENGQQTAAMSGQVVRGGQR